MRILKGFLFTASILVAIGLIGTIVTARSINFTEKLIETKEVDQDFTNIHITLDNATVELLPSDTETAMIELYGKHTTKKSKYKLEGNTKNGTFTVTLKEPRFKIFQFFPETYYLKVYVPEREYEKLQAENDNGKIYLTSLQANEIHLATDNGKIVLDHASTDIVQAKSKNGRIDITDVTASTIDAKTDNGKINITDAEGDIVGETNNGAISLKLNDIDRNIELEADNGKINLATFDEPRNATIQAFIDNGSVTIFGEKTPNKVYGNGENQIQLTTNNGIITVEKR